MTKKNILLLTITLLLASCASKLSIVKRKYNKGFYVSMNKKKHIVTKESMAHNQKAKQSPIKEVQTETSEAISSEVVKNQNAVTKTTNNKVLVKSSHMPQVENKIGVEKQMPLTASAKNDKFFHKAKEFKNIPMSLNKYSLKKKGGDTDTKTILMIILCLFPLINLIPVLLHDGKKVTLNFWITLLLNLTYIGAVIFSILVVLDVVNLA